MSNSHYRIFVDEGGYRMPGYWQDAARAGVWQPDGSILDQWGETSVPTPLRFGPDFDLPSQPVVGVCWFEAMAFCRWLTERLEAKGAIDASHEIRLPRSHEWRRAARGGPAGSPEPRIRQASTGLGRDSHPDAFQPGASLEERTFPWGDSLDEDRCVYHSTGLLWPAPVGCSATGRSPSGCEDMAGNVWEWCLDEAALKDGTLDEVRVGLRNLCGGSWYHLADDLRIDNDHCDWAHYRSRSIGFRPGLFYRD